MNWKDDEKDRKSLKYRCKTKDAKLYLQLKLHQGKFVTENWVTDLINVFDSSKAGFFNGFLTNFLPKKKH
jgi:hypothetical protein